MYKCAVLETSGDGMVYLCDVVVTKVNNPHSVVEIIDKMGEGFALEVKCDIGNLAILYCDEYAINLHETKRDEVIAKIKEFGHLDGPKMESLEVSTPLVPLVIFNNQQELIDDVNIYYDIREDK